MIKRIGLVGNPNVGKSTIFNALTKMRQHTGNWPGKTVEQAIGYFKIEGIDYEVIDLPGTYSLYANSKEEEITRDFIEEGNYELIIVVLDATCLKRSLLLGLQIASKCPLVLFVINLIDEAKKKGILVNATVLEKNIHLPVVSISAKNKLDIELVKKRIHTCMNSKQVPFHFTYPIVEDIDIEVYQEAEYHQVYDLYALCVSEGKEYRNSTLDYYLTHRFYGPMCMVAMLVMVCFLTISGANVPSSLLFQFFTWLETYLRIGLDALGVSPWLMGFVLDGIYRILTFVVSVMLPPMAIFFTLFAYLEEYGLLPRIAFNLDGYFHRCLGNGKMALCMCMGLGCNCVGVSGCRIMESEKDQYIGIITNSLMPCNGRFPMLITMIALFFTSSFPTIWGACVGALLLSLCIVLSIASTLLITYLLARFVYGAKHSVFLLELPPYRKPSLRGILTHSLCNRILQVLYKACLISALAGALLYALASTPLLSILVELLSPIGTILGVDGNVLVAFLLGAPANEIVLPILLMTYQGTSHITNVDLPSTLAILLANGWNMQRALCFIILVLFHFPCLTTLFTIYKETKKASVVWLSILVPCVYGFILCMIVNVFWS